MVIVRAGRVTSNLAGQIVGVTMMVVGAAIIVALIIARIKQWL